MPHLSSHSLGVELAFHKAEDPQQNRLVSQEGQRCCCLVSKSLTYTWPKLLTNAPGIQLALGSPQMGLTGSLWLSDIAKILRFSNFAAFRGRKRIIS